MFLHQSTGFHFCVACGAVGRRTAKDLLRPCEGTLTKAGQQNLCRLEQGLYPGAGAAAQQANAGKLARRGADDFLPGGQQLTLPGAARIEVRECTWEGSTSQLPSVVKSVAA